MTQDHGLPQTGDGQDAGLDAVDCLNANRPQSWRLTAISGENDYGFDFQVQLVRQQQVVHPFRVQLKGTRSPDFNVDRSFISIGLSASTLRYYDNTEEPVLLVLCDLSVDPSDARNCPLYFVWMREELDRIQIDTIPQTQQEATVRVPTANVLTRASDFLDEVRRRHRLARVGRSLESGIARKDPALGDDDIANLVEAMAENIGGRSLVFAQALAEPAKDVWLNPPRGSVPWLLTTARSAINAGKLDACLNLLGEIVIDAEAGDALEAAEYWHLRGRTRLAQNDDEGAAEAFKRAVMAKGMPKYWAAWAESEMRRRYRADASESYDDVIAELPTDTDSVLVSIKARLLAANKRHDEAIALLDGVDGEEGLAATAIIETMSSRHSEALAACVAALSLNLHRESLPSLFLVLRARARFNIALENAEFQAFDNHSTDNAVLPPSGPIGVDAKILRQAWEEIEEAVAALEEQRWISNAEFIVDIWVAAAGMLGKQSLIVDRVVAAARQRPAHAALQSAAETLSAQCGKFDLALEMNSRLVDSDQKLLRRCAFFHELGKHRDCVDLMDRSITSISRTHQMFGPSVVLAALSADIMARTDLVDAWQAILSAGGDDLRAHSATLAYMLTRQRDLLAGDAPLLSLLAEDKILHHPKPTTLLLFQELDPNVRDQAERLVEAFDRLRSEMRLAPMLVEKQAAGLACLERWPELLALCEEAEREFDIQRRVQAFRALALDQLGRVDDARLILEDMIEAGVDDALALNTYVNIMIRWGFADKARSAAELILQRAQTNERRIECVRLLFSLEQHTDSRSPRLVDLAFRMGALVSQQDEIQEGTFLAMAFTATMFEVNAMAEGRREEFNTRCTAYFANFPNSKVFRSIKIQQDDAPESILQSLRSVTGMSEETERALDALEEQVQSRELPVPFAWRPRHIFRQIGDVASLWEISKSSKIDEFKYHLTMLTQDWRETPASEFQRRTPVIDLLSLLVLRDLDLIASLFAFFSRVAIPKSALEQLLQLTQTFSSSDSRDGCVALRTSLQPFLAQIVQPRVRADALADDGLWPAEAEARSLVGDDEFFLYSDDAMSRILILNSESTKGSMSTLDFLIAMEEIGMISTHDVAQKIGKLCTWHVGLHVPIRHQIAVIPPSVNVASDVSTALALLIADPDFSAIADAVWSLNSESAGSVTMMGAQLRIMIGDSSLTDIAVAAFHLAWISKAAQREDVPASAPQLAAMLLVASVTTEKPSIDDAKRLWRLQWLMRGHFAGVLSSASKLAALKFVAEQAAALDNRVKKIGGPQSSTIGQRLMMGFTPSDDYWAAFSASYVKALQ